VVWLSVMARPIVERLAVGAALATLVLPFGASAEEPIRASLVYTADDATGTCPGENVLRERVVTRLGFDPFVPRAALGLRVHVASRGGRFVGEIDVSDHDGPPGRRTLSDASCTTLTETLASTLALTIDPIGLGAPPGGGAPPRTNELPALPTPQEAAPTPPAPTPPAPTTMPLPPHKSPPRDGAVVRPSITVDGFAHLGLAPSATFGGRLGLGLVVRGFSLHVEGSTERTASAAGTTDQLVAAVHAAHVVPCGGIGTYFLVCGDVSLGIIDARAALRADPPSGDAFVALGLRAGVRYPMTRAFSVRAAVESGVVPVRVGYMLDGARVATTGPVYFGLALGLEGRAP